MYGISYGVTYRTDTSRERGVSAVKSFLYSIRGGVVLSCLMFMVGYTNPHVATTKHSAPQSNHVVQALASYTSSTKKTGLNAVGSSTSENKTPLAKSLASTPSTEVVGPSSETSLQPTSVQSPNLLNPYPNQPPSTGSFYVKNLDAAKAQLDGESHGSYANAVGGWGGMVILDFGCQNGYQTTQLYNQTTTANASQIAQLALDYARGFSYVAPGVPLDLVIGTSNSCPNYVNYTDGVGWEQLVAIISQQVKATDSNISVLGGSDFETEWSSGSSAQSWVQGYAAAAGSYQPGMVDYGDMAPGYWTTSQELYVSFGAEPSVAAPQLNVLGR